MDAGQHGTARRTKGSSRGRAGTQARRRPEGRRFTVTEMVDWKAWLSRLLTSSRGRVGDSELVVLAAMSRGGRLIRDREEACPGERGARQM